MGESHDVTNKIWESASFISQWQNYYLNSMQILLKSKAWKKYVNMRKGMPVCLEELRVAVGNNYVQKFWIACQS